MTTSAESLDALTKQMMQLTARIEVLENETSLLRRALKRLLGDDDQAYYWTPQWQQGEAMAEEELRNGDFQSFDDGEALIEYIQTLIEEPA
ncbi:MAG: hypothetical protein R3A44_18810 [Caldilineaceae bacterium]